MQWRMGNLRALQEKLSSMIHPETVEEKQEEEAANAIPASVRVLLMENDSQIYRNKVSIAGDQGIILDDGTRQWTASAGEVVTFDGTDPALSSWNHHTDAHGRGTVVSGDGGRCMEAAGLLGQDGSVEGCKWICPGK